jgi:hypothetical protein
MKSTMASPDEPWVILGDRLQFLGKPPLCLGHVHLQNRSLEKVRIKRIPLVASKLTGPAEVSISHLQLFARLLPGTALQATAQVLIPPQTPPGRYTAEALVGNVRKPVSVDVLESWDIGIIPASLSLKFHAGERLVRTVQLANRGNMPWDLRRAAFAPLQEVGGVHRSIFLSLKETVVPNYEVVLNNLVKQMQDTEVEPAKIRILSKVDVLPPGESRDLEIEISLPDNLKKGRRYNGEVSFENALLLLDIEVLENSARKRS